MALEVYWASGSTPAWRVLLTLAVKSAPYESRMIRLTRREQTRPDFLAVNPRGKVPAIRDGSFTLRESIAIMAYLDRRFPAPPLFGETPEETGLIHCAIAEHESYYRTPMLAFVRPILYGGPGATTGQDEALRTAGAAIRAELARLEATLDTSPYVVNARLSAADIAVYPNVQLTLRAAARPIAQRLDLGLAPLADRFPSIAAWCARIEAIPGYDSTYPPTWREA